MCSPPSPRGPRCFLVVCCALALSLSSACVLFHPKPLTHIDDDWHSPLDGDLRAAAATADRDFAERGWDIRIRWVGARGSDYGIKRNAFGQPIRQEVEILYAYTYRSRKKCYLSDH